MSTTGARWRAALFAGVLMGAFGPLGHAAPPKAALLAAGDIGAAQWRTLAPKEKFGFIMGIEECQLLNAHTNIGLSAIEEVEVALMDKFADVFYMESPNESMDKAWEDMTSTKTRPTKKDIEDYWGSDDDYVFWASRNAPGYHRGFVEGHIACRERHGALRWSKPIDFYLEKLDRYYNPDFKYGKDQGEDSISSQLTKYADPR